MFEEVKAKLLEQPESIVNILEAFGCHKVRINDREIRCAREEFANPTATAISSMLAPVLSRSSFAFSTR